MNSVPRKLTLGLMVAFGAAACGDDVTVTEQAPPPAPTPVVRSVVVSPSAATVAANGTFQFGAAVDADAGLSGAVTWSSSNSGVAGVNATGLATAGAAAGQTSICATSTADATKSSCAQLTVTAAPAPQPATVEINAVTVGCDAISAAIVGLANCGLNNPVATNNVFGQVDVAVNVNRPAGSTVTGVVLEVLPATGTTPEATYTQTLAADAAPAAEGLAAQVANNRVVFSVQTAAYNMNTGAVTHVNGQKRIRVRLTGGNTGSALAETQLTFRNANGFHIVTGAIPATNGNPGGSFASQQSLAGRLWTGGVPLSYAVVPVSYTGDAVNFATLNVTFGNAGCDLTGVGPRTVVASTGTATFAYTNAHTAGATNVNNYTFNAAACGAANPLGEFVTATAVATNGNPFINFSLGGNFGTNNLLNNPVGPVVPGTTAQLASGIRLDNGAPALAIVPNTNPGGRANQWINDAVVFDAVGAAATNNLLLTGTTLTDAGIGGPQHRARVGATLAAAVATTTDLSNATTLAASATNAAYCIANYGIDAFGNRTANPATCTTGANVGVDRAPPVVTFAGGSIPANDRRNGVTIGGEIIVALNDTGLVGNSGMNPTTPMVGSIVRRNAASASTCVLGSGVGCVTQAALAGAPPTMSTAIGATAINGYFTFNGTARDAAGNSTTIGPRVFVYDASGPIVAIAGLPATVTASGYTATSNVSEDVDVQSQWFSVGYAGAPAPLGGTLLAQAPTVVNTFPGIPATLLNSNVPVSQVISLPLAVQANMAAGLTLQSSVNANAFNQANVPTAGATAAPVITAPTALAIPAAWTSFNAPTAPAGVTGLTAGVSAGNAANPTSVTFSITTTGATAIFNNPFTRVEFFALSEAGEYRLIGTATAATLNDNGLVRTFTYSTSVAGSAVGSLLFNPAPPAPGTSYASTVIALGYGASNNVAMISSAGLAFNIRN